MRYTPSYVAWHAFRLQIPSGIRAISRFVRDYQIYSQQKSNPNFLLSTDILDPCLKDWTTVTPVEPIYLLQDSWAAGRIFQIKPRHHVDVGSKVTTVAIIAQFVPTTMIDIRPVTIKVPGLEFIEGSILNLPFEDNSVECLSSICVIEHIGLGRYGDPLDTWGSEKAIAEMRRVLKPGGHFIVTVPVDNSARIYFNAHRAFTRDSMLTLLDGMTLLDEKYIYGHGLYDSYDSTRGFGTGLFHVRK